MVISIIGRPPADAELIAAIAQAVLLLARETCRGDGGWALPFGLCTMNQHAACLQKRMHPTRGKHQPRWNGISPTQRVC